MQRLGRPLAIPLWLAGRTGAGSRSIGSVAMAKPKKQKPAKHHHTVPQFLLERFSENGVVTLIDRRDFSTRRDVGVRVALAQNDFYTLKTEHGPDTSVETDLFAKQIEAPAATAIRRVIDHNRPPSFPALRQHISLFLAFQIVRGESTRDAITSMMTANYRKVVSLLTPEMLRRQSREMGIGEQTDEEIRELWEFAQSSEKYKVEVNDETAAHLGLGLPIALELMPFLMKRHWSILEFDEPLLLTGDEPLALIGDTLEPGEIGGVERAPQIVFATDPHHALVMIRRDLAAEDDRHKGTAHMAEIINRNVAFGCHRFVAQRPGDDLTSGLVLPEKAPSTQTVGNYVLVNPRRSVAAAAEVRQRAEAMGKRRGHN